MTQLTGRLAALRQAPGRRGTDGTASKKNHPRKGTPPRSYKARSSISSIAITIRLTLSPSPVPPPLSPRHPRLSHRLPHSITLACPSPSLTPSPSPVRWGTSLHGALQAPPGTPPTSRALLPCGWLREGEGEGEGVEGEQGRGFRGGGRDGGRERRKVGGTEGTE